MKKAISAILVFALCAAMTVPTFAENSVTLSEEDASITFLDVISYEDVPMWTIVEEEPYAVETRIYHLPSNASIFVENNYEDPDCTYEVSLKYQASHLVDGVDIDGTTVVFPMMFDLVHYGEDDIIEGTVNLREKLQNTSNKDNVLHDGESSGAISPSFPTEAGTLVRIQLWLSSRSAEYGNGGSLPVMDVYCAFDDGAFSFSEYVGKTPGSSTKPEQSGDSIPPTTTTFSDVAADAYYAAPVAWAVKNEITSGTGNNKFSPKDTCNQAQILFFLWRAQGAPEPSIAKDIPGIDASAYYYKAVLWAVEKQIIEATGFSPKTPCTRAMAITYMWKFAGCPDDGNTIFSDVPAKTELATAVAWAVDKNITSGTGKNQFSPEKICDRGQIVTFLYKAFAN